MQRLQKLALPLRILVYAAAAAAALAVAAGVGATTALLMGPDEDPSGGARSQQAGGAKPEQASQQESAPDRQGEAGYLDTVGEIQNGAVEASLQSNGKLLRYDTLDPGDIEEMEANYDTLGDYTDRVEDLHPPKTYGDQYKLFVLDIDQLYAGNQLAYRLAADPASATQAGFEAYDQHVDRATAHLQRSNKIMDRDYKTTKSAQDTSFG